MQPNVGNVDRILRLVAGVFILSLYFWGPQSPWALIGIVPIATALFRFCPAYTILGIRTCRTE
ncbi:MAG: DUF2892 domain-containing protein [Alphaproteobacteria bacterium]|nr:DUF2892 domain-containing protein [Alphaproteobacteria bacterium]